MHSARVPGFLCGQARFRNLLEIQWKDNISGAEGWPLSLGAFWEESKKVKFIENEELMTVQRTDSGQIYFNRNISDAENLSQLSLCFWRSEKHMEKYFPFIVPLTSYNVAEGSISKPSLDWEIETGKTVYRLCTHEPLGHSEKFDGNVPIEHIHVEIKHELGSDTRFVKPVLRITSPLNSNQVVMSDAIVRILKANKS